MEVVHRNKYATNKVICYQILAELYSFAGCDQLFQIMKEISKSRRDDNNLGLN